jgi:sialic acid synthase SpsE
MSEIILDFGSGNTCRNDLSIAIQMIDELNSIDTEKHDVIIKWQLFKQAGDNIPLQQDVFDFAYHYAKKYGYETTASVFDQESLDFLLKYDVPMIKIANRRDLDWLIGEIPRKIKIYISDTNDFNYCDLDSNNITKFCCVSKYPATIEDYEEEWAINFEISVNMYSRNKLKKAVSDHTSNLELWNKYQPEIIEWHYKLENSTGLDAGSFARTPQQLAEVL